MSYEVEGIGKNATDEMAVAKSAQIIQEQANVENASNQMIIPSKEDLRREKTMLYCLRMIKRCWKVGLQAAKLQGKEEYKAVQMRYEEFRIEFLAEHPEAANIFTSKI